MDVETELELRRFVGTAGRMLKDFYSDADNVRAFEEWKEARQRKEDPRDRKKRKAATAAA